jgi:hypothetical protein
LLTNACDQQQIERFVGTAPAFMHLQVKNWKGELLSDIAWNDNTSVANVGELVAKHADQPMPLTLHVIDSDPKYDDALACVCATTADRWV